MNYHQKKHVDQIKEMQLSGDLQSMFLDDLDYYKRVKRTYQGIRNQRRHNPGFNLSLKEWIEVWFQWDAVTKDYYFNNRTNKRPDGYVMSRFNDAGPYEVGNIFIQTHRENIREAMIGRSPSEETRSKISAKNNGRKLPPRRKEHCEAISKGLTGTVFDEARCKRISEALRGRKLSEEHKENLRTAALSFFKRQKDQ